MIYTFSIGFVLIFTLVGIRTSVSFFDKGLNRILADVQSLRVKIQRKRATEKWTEIALQKAKAGF